MTVHSLFSIPIVHYEIQDWVTNKERIMNALPEFREEHLESNGEQYTDFFHMDEELLPAYADTVIAIIEPYLADFTEHRRIEFTDMWCQTSYKGQKHGLHNHGHSGWSAVIYVDFDPKHHRATQFISPFNNPWSGRLQTFIPPVKEGDMVIFPATVAHEALPNESDKPRTIVSFNLRGKVDKVKKTMWDGDPIVRV
jgi:uncharacterized protein (TIGR02466 family)|tara:strand:- start:148 stop:735 length:588 start_codon:yes stop_codon:yes gene_type:complete